MKTLIASKMREKFHRCNLNALLYMLISKWYSATITLKPIWEVEIEKPHNTYPIIA